MNKKLIIIFTGFLWIAIAISIILSKQHILLTGKTIVLETVPVDPRDFLRGDYMVLRYKLNLLNLNMIKSKKSYYHPNENIYVELEPKDIFWEPTAVYEKKNNIKGVFIKGKVKNCYNKILKVNYGIENYFVPEGKGKDFEIKMIQGIEVMVDSSGKAVIKRVYENNKVKSEYEEIVYENDKIKAEYEERVYENDKVYENNKVKATHKKGVFKTFLLVGDKLVEQETNEY